MVVLVSVLFEVVEAADSVISTSDSMDAAVVDVGSVSFDVAVEVSVWVGTVVVSVTVADVSLSVVVGKSVVVVVGATALLSKIRSYVVLSTSPVTLRRLAFWNCLTASLVALSYVPVTFADGR